MGTPRPYTFEETGRRRDIDVVVDVRPSLVFTVYTTYVLSLSILYYSYQFTIVCTTYVHGQHTYHCLILASP